MSRKATCCYCKQVIEESKVTFQQKSFHPQCLEAYKTELKQSAKAKDQRQAAKYSQTASFDPSYSELISYICQLLDLAKPTPLILKQVSDFHLQRGYSYQDIRLALRYFYEFSDGRFDIPSDSIGIVPYVFDEAMDFWALSQDANQYNQNKPVTNITVVHKYHTTPSPIHSPFKMEDI